MPILVGAAAAWKPGYVQRRARARLEAALDDIDELLVLVGQGDRAAFRLLVRGVGPRLLARVRRVVHDPAQSDEIVQDVLLRVWQRAASFDPALASGWTWIYAVARNRAIDVARQLRVAQDTRARVEPDWGDTAFLSQSFDAPDRQLHLAHRKAQVHQALTSLPDAQREVLELAYFESMTFTDIAEQRGIPTGTAKSRVRLAFQKLRQLIVREEEL